MRKLFMFFALFILMFFAKGQSLSFELGSSTYSSGAGIQAEFSIWKLGFCVGVGSVLNEGFKEIIRPGGGLRYYFIDTKFGSPYLGASYGRTDYAYSKNSGVVSKNEVYYGPAFGGGFKFLIGKSKNLQIRTGLFAAYQPKLSEYYQVLRTSAKWILAPDITIGYNLSFKK